MVRVNQYLLAVRYSSFSRKGSYFPDRFSRSRLWKASSKSGGNTRCRVFRTRYLYEVLPVSVSTGMEFIQSGYVTLPALGTLFGSRKKKFILLKGVEIQETFRTMSLPVDSKEGVSMEIERPATPGVHGMATLFVVLDKLPSGDELSKFEDIFEFKEGGYQGDASLRNSSLERYAVIIKKQNVFHSNESTRIIPFRASYVPKENIWVEFHDYDDTSRGGNFKNIAANGLLYFVVYESHVHSICWPAANSCISY